MLRTDTFQVIFTSYTLRKPNPSIEKFISFCLSKQFCYTLTQQVETLTVDLRMSNVWKFNVEANLSSFKLCLARATGMRGGVVGIPVKDGQVYLSHSKTAFLKKIFENKYFQETQCGYKQAYICIMQTL